MSMRLDGCVCLVTGATRGIGKGIALQLGEAGATVYITGRTLQSTGFGSLKDTCAEIENRGGKCIPVACDHSDDQQVKSLFERIEHEQDGRLDCLVNNAFAAASLLGESFGKPYWDTDPALMWDTVNQVGLRNHYLCATFATRLMIKRRRGLIVNVSSVGGMAYFMNCCYGIGKTACDRMAADCSIELKPFGVVFVSLWPGAVRTELMLANEQMMKERLGRTDSLLDDGESTEFAGKAVVALLSDPHVSGKSGRVLLATDLANEYGFTDDNGRRPPSMRCISYLLKQIGFHRLSSWIPSCLKLPFWVFDINFSRFRCPDDTVRKQLRQSPSDDAKMQH